MLLRYAGIEPRRDVEYARRGTTARVASYTTLFDRNRPQGLADRRLRDYIKGEMEKQWKRKLRLKTW